MKLYNTLKSKFSQKSSFIIVGFLLLIIMFFVYLRNYVPINILSLPFDDELFIRRADLINRGELTTFTSGYNPLVKGVAYPWLLVVANFFEINPILIPFSILILCVCLIAYFLLTKKQLIFVCLAIFLVFLDPSPYKSAASRVARETFYAAGLLLTITGIIIFALMLNNKILSIQKQLTLGIFSGFFLFVTQNIREERVWIYLSVAITIAISYFILMIKSKKHFIYFLLFASLMIISHFSFTNIIKYFHSNIYGVYLTSTTIEGEFPRLLSNLSSINVGVSERQYVAITAQKRIVAYGVSPTFNLMSDYLEGPGGMWVQLGCDNSDVCDDYANSYFHVALREAMKINGFWQNQKQAQAFMAVINDEIESACKAGKIECSTALPLARGLGVTKISRDQVIDSGFYLKEYIIMSINNWDVSYSFKDTNLRFQENYYYTNISEESWNIWSNVVTSLPLSQRVFADQYNYKIGKITGLLSLWNYLYSYILKVGIVILSLMNLLYFAKKLINKTSKQALLIANITFLIWLTRGLLLAFNSSTNFVSISEYYSLPGRVFLSITISLAIISFILTVKSQKNSWCYMRARRDSNP